MNSIRACSRRACRALPNTRSVRVAGGLGTVARVVGDSQEIYAHKLRLDEVLARIETLYKPYHRALETLLSRAWQAFGDGGPDRLSFDAVSLDMPAGA